MLNTLIHVIPVAGIDRSDFLEETVGVGLRAGTVRVYAGAFITEMGET